MSNNKSSTGTFPAPYMNDVRESDPMMVRVDQDKLEIGARNSGMPKEISSQNMGIDHVGKSAS